MLWRRGSQRFSLALDASGYACRAGTRGGMLFTKGERAILRAACSPRPRPHPIKESSPVVPFSHPLSRREIMAFSSLVRAQRILPGLAVLAGLLGAPPEAFGQG